MSLRIFKNFHLNQLKLEEHLNMCIYYMNVNINLDPLCYENVYFGARISIFV